MLAVGFISISGVPASHRLAAIWIAALGVTFRVTVSECSDAARRFRHIDNQVLHPTFPDFFPLSSALETSSPPVPRSIPLGALAVSWRR